MDFTNDSEGPRGYPLVRQHWYEYLYRPTYGLQERSWLSDYLSKPKAFQSAIDEPPRDLVDRMLFDQKQVLGERIDSINKRIASRWQVFRENVYGIGLQECIVCSTMDNLPGGMPYQLSKRMQGLELELHQLKKERRGESTELWKDLSKLEAELIEAVHEYRKADRNETLLTGEENGDR